MQAIAAAMLLCLLMRLAIALSVSPASALANFRRLRELRSRSAVMGQDLLAEQTHLLL